MAKAPRRIVQQIGGRKPRRTGYKKRRTGISGAMTNRRSGGFSTQERKFHDATKAETGLQPNTFTNALVDPPTANCLNGILQGVGESQRIGRTYRIMSCFIRGYISRNSQTLQAAPIDDNWVRMALVLDTQTNGLAFAPQNVWTDTATFKIADMQQLENSTRFKILKDKVFRIPSNSMTSGAGEFAADKVIIPFKIGYKFRMPLKVRCASTVATVAAISDYSLHMVACAADNLCKITYNSRLRFLD